MSPALSGNPLFISMAVQRPFKCIQKWISCKIHLYKLFLCRLCFYSNHAK